MRGVGWDFVGDVLVQPLAQDDGVVQRMVVHKTSFKSGGQNCSFSRARQVQPRGFRGVLLPSLKGVGEVGEESGWVEEI